jgi:hypothetical protein
MATRLKQVLVGALGEETEGARRATGVSSPSAGAAALPAVAPAPACSWCLSAATASSIAWSSRSRTSINGSRETMTLCSSDELPAVKNEGIPQGLSLFSAVPVSVALDPSASRSLTPFFRSLEIEPGPFLLSPAFLPLFILCRLVVEF